MTGNRNIVDVVLVGPRAKETCRLAGFDFVDGVAQVPAAAMTALNILAKYHSAYPRGSREHEDAEAKWERRSKGAAQGQADTEYLAAREREQRHAFEEVTSELDRLRAELRTAQAQLRDATVATPAPTPPPAPVPAPAEESPAPKGKAKAKAE